MAGLGGIMGTTTPVLKNLPVIKDSCLLFDILSKAESYSPRMYIITMFMVVAGLKLSDVLELRASDVTGNAFYNDKHNRLVIYGGHFSCFLNSYIKDNKLLKRNLHLLFKANNKREHISHSEASLSITRFFKSLGYKGGAMTLNRTFYFQYAVNYGSLDPIVYDNACQIKWVENSLDIAYEDYKALKNQDVPPNILGLYKGAALSYLKSAEEILQSPDTPESLKVALKKQLYELYKTLYGVSVNADISL